MTSQQFSVSNLRKIWDVRTRRGEDLNSFFATVQEAHSYMRTLALDYRKETKNLPQESDLRLTKRSEYRTKIERYRKERDRLLATELHAVSQDINANIDSNRLSWGLRHGPVVKDKQTYCIALDSPVIYFTARQMENNLRSVFNVRQANRNLNSEQLLMTLNDSTSKFVVKSDLKSYYESVNHEQLLGLLRMESGLSRTTIRFVEELLREYSLLSGAKFGLPRGLGISAILAEIYLQPIDYGFARLSGVIAYLRYVDDFIIVFSVGRHLPDDENRKKLIRGIVSNAGLRLNGPKTKYYNFSRQSTIQKISFLGYQYTIDRPQVTVDITVNRLNRYRRKILAAFESYAKSPRDPRAEIALVERLDFLTSNTRLANNKRQALAGIYYSNSLLQDPTPRIFQLDKYLASQIRTTKLSTATTIKLQALKFSEGFAQKRFHVYSPIRIGNIVKAWINV